MKRTKTVFAPALLALSLVATTGRAHAAPFDQAWIDAMAPHHMMAAQMAQIAAQKARYPEVRALARKVVRDQNKEVAQMKAWRKAWYGSAEVPMNHMMHTMPGGQPMRGMMMGADKMMSPSMMMGLPMKMTMDMGQLRNARGAQVDKMFLSMMIPHHAGAIVMADEALKVTARPQIRALSHSIIDSQAKEIGEMRAIHRRYFGKL